MEKFLWFSDVIEKSNRLVVACGPGFCSMVPAEGSYASVAQIREGEVAGTLGSATALLVVDDGVSPRFVLLEQDAGASVAPLKWQFPAGRSEPEELPLTTACRELTEEIRIFNHEELVSFNSVEINLGRRVVEFLTQDTLHEFKARHVICHNTVEFYFPMRLAVNAVAHVYAEDNESYQRKVSLLSFDEVECLASRGLLTESALAIWRHWTANA